ncbi:unnamed protein product [Closterium sp. NIES-54]
MGEPYRDGAVEGGRKKAAPGADPMRGEEYSPGGDGPMPSAAAAGAGGPMRQADWELRYQWAYLSLKMGACFPPTMHASPPPFPFQPFPSPFLPLPVRSGSLPSLPSRLLPPSPRCPAFPTRPPRAPQGGACR